jgi:hypothetical protein
MPIGERTASFRQHGNFLRAGNALRIAMLSLRGIGGSA